MEQQVAQVESLDASIERASTFRERIAADERFQLSGEELERWSAPERLVGRAPAQVYDYLARVVAGEFESLEEESME